MTEEYEEISYSIAEKMNEVRKEKDEIKNLNKCKESFNTFKTILFNEYNFKQLVESPEHFDIKIPLDSKLGKLSQISQLCGNNGYNIYDHLNKIPGVRAYKCYGNDNMIIHSKN